MCQARGVDLEPTAAFVRLVTVRLGAIRGTECDASADYFRLLGELPLTSFLVNLPATLQGPQHFTEAHCRDKVDVANKLTKEA